MKAILLADCLSLVASLAQAQKSPPYDPRTGVYTIDFDAPSKAQKGEQSAGSQGAKAQAVQPAPKVTYPPGYWEKQEQLQREEVAEYERRYREQKQAEELRAAEERAAKRWEEWQESEKQRRRDEVAEERKRSKRRDDDEERRKTSAPRGAVNPATGEFYAPAGGGNLVGTRDGTLYTPAGPNGYINTRNGQFVPLH